MPPQPMVTLLKGVHEGCGVGTIFTDEAGATPNCTCMRVLDRNDNTVTGCVRVGVDVWQIGEVVILGISWRLSEKSQKTNKQVLNS